MIYNTQESIKACNIDRILVALSHVIYITNRINGLILTINYGGDKTDWEGTIRKF
jgi:hypothetical protein